MKNNRGEQHSNEQNAPVKKSLLQSKFWNAAVIGFLSGIFTFGMVSWVLSEKRSLGVLIVMAIPLVMIVRIVKAGKSAESRSSDSSVN